MPENNVNLVGGSGVFYGEFKLRLKTAAPFVLWNRNGPLVQINGVARGEKKQTSGKAVVKRTLFKYHAANLKSVFNTRIDSMEP